MYLTPHSNVLEVYKSDVDQQFSELSDIFQSF